MAGGNIPPLRKGKTSEGFHCCRNNINHPAMKTFCLKVLLSSSTLSEVLFKPDKKSRETVQTGYYIFIKGGAWPVLRIGSHFLTRGRVTSAHNIQRVYSSWGRAQLWQTFSSQGQSGNLWVIYPGNLWREWEPVLSCDKNRYFSTEPVITCCTQACLYNNCTTLVQRSMLQIEWS